MNSEIIKSAYSAGCRLVFTEKSGVAVPEGMLAVKCGGPKSAVHAALGASLAGSRALALLDEVTAKLPESRVNGGAIIAMPGTGEAFPSLAAAFRASEAADRPVVLDSAAVAMSEEDAAVSIKYRKQPERFVGPCERETLCPGCPYRAAFYLASKLWLRTIGDAGCSRLGAKRPFLALDAAWGRGTALAALSGFLLAMPEAGRDTIAVIGSGDVDAEGLELLARSGGTALIVGDGDIAGLCRNLGLETSELDAQDVNGLEAELKRALAADSAEAIICRGKCALSPDFVRGPAFRTDPNRCRRCGACGRLGCPAISGRSPVIDASECAGCGLCAKVCKCSAVAEM